MSTQETAALIESVNQMTATVAGKMGQIDQKVEQTTQKFNDFIGSADERYKTQASASFKVGGQWDKFYPVRISLLGGPVNNLTIYRPNTYENLGAIDGLAIDINPSTFTASVLAIGDAYGHRVPFYAFDTYHYQAHQFIGKIANNYKIQSLWVWLRGGGVTYYINHDSFFIHPEKIRSFDAATNDLADAISIYLGGFNYSGIGVNYAPILATEIDPSLPSNGYVRGVS